MGTVFLATHEAFTDAVRFGWLTEEGAQSWKQALIEASESDTVISRARTGKTARYIKNKLVELWDKSGLAPLPYELQTILMRDIDAAYAHYLGGQVTGMIRNVKKAEEIVQAIVEQAVSVLKSNAAKIS